MGHIAHQINKSSTFLQSSDYTITLIKREINQTNGRVLMSLYSTSKVIGIRLWTGTFKRENLISDFLTTKLEALPLLKE